MEDDIYTMLLREGYLNREVDLDERRRLRLKEKNRNKVIKKILYNDISSDEDEEDYSLTATQLLNNLYIDQNINTNNSNNILDHYQYLLNKYEIELHGYFVITSNNLSKMKVGGYVRYVNINDELKWGGVLVNIINPKKITRMKLCMKNTNNNYWNVKFKNNYIFYKNNISKYDKFKELFISTAHMEF